MHLHGLVQKRLGQVHGYPLLDSWQNFPEFWRSWDALGNQKLNLACKEKKVESTFANIWSQNELHSYVLENVRRACFVYLYIKENEFLTKESCDIQIKIYIELLSKEQYLHTICVKKDYLLVHS